VRRSLVPALILLVLATAACSGDDPVPGTVTPAPITTAGTTAAPSTPGAVSTTAAVATTAAVTTTTAGAADLDPVGIWLAEIMGMRVQITVEQDGPRFRATLDSIDQGIFGISATRLAVGDNEVTVEFADIGGVFVGTPAGDGRSIEGVWTQGAAETPVTFVRVDEPFAYDRPQEPQPPFPYTVEEVTFDNEQAGFTLAGTLTIPEGDGPFPGVVLITGSGPQDRNEELVGHKPFLVIADHLTRHGIAVLRYDDRGFGESDGRFPGATSADLVTDAAAAFDYLIGRAEVDTAAVGLIGHSEGGMIAPMLAAPRSDVGFVVMLAGPGQRGADLLILQTEMLLRAEGAPDDAVAWQLGWVVPVIEVAASDLDDEAARAEIGDIVAGVVAADPEQVAAGELGTATEIYLDPWMRFFLAHDPAPFLERLQMPVLALNGTLDMQVPVDENLSRIEQALDAAGNPDHTVRAMAGLNHLFQHAETGAIGEYARITETFAPEVLDLMSSWILERFG